jgi:hypothetical protein
MRNDGGNASRSSRARRRHDRTATKFHQAGRSFPPGMTT